MPFRSFRLLVATALVVVLTAFSATPVAALDARFPSAERYALSLLNCTRTGGFIKANGTCIDRGTGNHSPYRKPLPMMARLANDIARPQARRIARAGYLSHTLGGSISTRFSRAGIQCCAMGESLGHFVHSAKAAVRQISLWVQAEEASNGWHWRNMKDRRFKHVGIGVWSRGSNDFYVAYDFWDGNP